VPQTFHQATRAFQKGLLERALKECDWDVMGVAHRLDLSRAHVYNLIRGFALEKGDG